MVIGSEYCSLGGEWSLLIVNSSDWWLVMVSTGEYWTMIGGDWW